MAFWLLLTAPEVAVKVALLWPSAIMTLTGTASSPLSLASATLAALVAPVFNVTVQVLDELLPRVEGAQASEESCIGAVALSVKLCETPLRVAVNRAV